MPRNRSRQGRSQILKGKKGSQRPGPGSKPGAHRLRQLAARRRRARERAAKDSVKERRAAFAEEKKAAAVAAEGTVSPAGGVGASSEATAVVTNG